MSVTATDFFCGMGGSSSGLVGAGYDVKVAANHWGVAIETHSANHPNTEHLCADVSQIDLRYLPTTDLLWASPICTELSPAGGRKRRDRQPGLFEQHGHVAAEAFERTRVTFWEVIRATEIHRYNAVIIENVIEAVRDWELFDVWLSGMVTLGYNHQFVSVSAAHVGDDNNPHAPQWRDRIYVVFTRHGIRLPDVDPRPLAWCHDCGGNVRSVQWWKPRKGQKSFMGRKVGKYGPQYIYVCDRGHGAVEPYVRAAADAIDWTDLGTRIGDRDKPLGAATMRRIQLGLGKVGDPALIAANGNTYDGASGANNNYVRAWPVNGSPTPVQVTEIQNGIAMSGKFVMGVNHGGSDGRHFDPSTAPTPTRSVKNGEALVMTDAFVSMFRNHGGNHPIDKPLQTIAAGGTHHGLVIPYRKGAKAYRADSAPLSTMATHDQHGVVHPKINIDDCHFRMLTPREAANAQRFDRKYVICGNQGEMQMQAGNAVAVNVAHWLGAQTAQVLS